MLEAIDVEIVPQAKRYTENDRAAWYLYWRTIGGKSISKTAKRFNVDYNTIRNWRQNDQWDTRAHEDDQDDFSSAHIGVAAIAVNELVPSIEKMRYLRDHAQDERVQADASKWLAGLSGVSPVSRIEQAVTDKRGTVVEVMPDFDTMQIEEIRAYELSKRPKRSTG